MNTTNQEIRQPSLSTIVYRKTVGLSIHIIGTTLLVPIAAIVGACAGACVGVYSIIKVIGKNVYNIIHNKPLKPIKLSHTQSLHVVDCPICLHNCENVITTKCGHEFCLECFKTHIYNTGHDVDDVYTCECPTCHAVVVAAKL
jgi:hypothetical protein